LCAEGRTSIRKQDLRGRVSGGLMLRDEKTEMGTEHGEPTAADEWRFDPRFGGSRADGEGA
jgi:hypothetical protein